MQLHLRSALAPLTAALALVGCASLPPYETPPPPAGADYTASALATPTASAPGLHGQAQQWVDGAVEGAWWHALRSSALDALVDEALHASPTLAAAQAVLTQARELHAAQAGATQRPQVDLGLGAQRQQTSPSAQGLPGDPREFSLYSASVGVRYRFDVGGGIDSGLRAAAARADVRQHELA
ncbi:MAG: TolC family protein, partial [Giesbergeria sp.]